MKRFMIAAASLLLFFGNAYATTMQSLSQSQVNGLLKGNTITTIPLVTIDGSLVSNTFTGYFSSDGKLQGKMSSKPENGPTSDSGTWTVKTNGVLCATWEHWNNSKPICISVYKVNNGLLFINEKSRSLETIILTTNIKSGNQLS